MNQGFVQTKSNKRIPLFRVEMMMEWKKDDRDEP
jgi:hypothetical protein